MNKSIKNISNQITNTLTSLYDKDLIQFFLNPKIETIMENNKYYERITWPHHLSDRRNTEKYWGKIDQYKFILNSDAYTAILHDGGIIRVSYSFDLTGRLCRHNLLYWPPPFTILKSDLEMGSLQEIFECYENDKKWSELLNMRSPLRFDYDIDNEKNGHPMTHLHLQNSDCRIMLNKPVCFNQFVKIIYMNFYPEIYEKYKFWNELDNTLINIKYSDPIHKYHNNELSINLV